MKRDEAVFDTSMMWYSIGKKSLHKMLDWSILILTTRIRFLLLLCGEVDEQKNFVLINAIWCRCYFLLW